MSFVVQEIQGVPYWIDSATNGLFLYGSSPPLQVGTVEPKTKVPTFAPTWKEDVKDFLIAYRQRLGGHTEAELASVKAAAAAAANTKKMNPISQQTPL